MTKLIATAAACLAGGIVAPSEAWEGTASWPGTRAAASFAPWLRSVIVEDAAAKEAKLLQGTWQGVEIETNGTESRHGRSEGLTPGISRAMRSS